MVGECYLVIRSSPFRLLFVVCFQLQSRHSIWDTISFSPCTVVRSKPGSTRKSININTMCLSWNTFQDWLALVWLSQAKYFIPGPHPLPCPAVHGIGWLGKVINCVSHWYALTSHWGDVGGLRGISVIIVSALLQISSYQCSNCYQTGHSLTWLCLCWSCSA